jgi:hypothetical protein
MIADVIPVARRAVLAAALPESYTDKAEPPYDAAFELSFARVAEFERVWAGGGAAVLVELDDVVDRDRSCGLLVDLRVIWPEAAWRVG